MNSQYRLILYVAGDGDLARRAIGNFENLRSQCLPEGCDYAVVDIVEDREQARRHRIIATPILVKESPGPLAKVLGDLSNLETVIDALGLPCPPAQNQ